MSIKKLSIIFILALLNVGCSNQIKETAFIETEQEVVLEKPEIKIDPVVRNVKISATGDLMVHNYQYNEAYQSDTGIYDFLHNFQDLKRYFEKSDIVIGNLETVFAGEEVGYSDYPCFNTPDSFGQALKDAGFNMLTTANNHSMDKHDTGLLRTIDILDGLGIDHVGTYKTQNQRDTVFVKDVNGIKIAFLSYTYGTNGIAVNEDFLINRMTEELIKNDLKKAKDLNPDLIIVMPHMGNEYELVPNQTFQNWADLMFDSGADIILASHPHVLQPMEMKTIINEDGTTRQGFVIYSLGNCISSQTTPPRNAGVVLNIEIQKIDNKKPTIEQVSFVPIWTQFRGTDGKDHFVVRSVYEMLTLPEDEKNAQIRKKDIARLKDIHTETTSLFLNKEVPLEEIQDEYIFYKK